MTRTATLLVACSATVIVLGLPQPATAQLVCADPANLTTNCGFDAGIAGWTVIAGTESWDGVNGNDGVGCARVVSEPVMGEQVWLQQCVSTGITAGTTYGVGAFISVIAGTPAYADLNIERFSSVGCTSGHLGTDSTTMSTFPLPWNKMYRTVTTGGGTQSVRLTLYLDNFDQQFTVCLDDIFLGPDLTPVALQHLDVE